MSKKAKQKRATDNGIAEMANTRKLKMGTQTIIPFYGSGRSVASS
jgi:hypothetical protein